MYCNMLRRELTYMYRSRIGKTLLFEPIHTMILDIWNSALKLGKYLDDNLLGGGKTDKKLLFLITAVKLIKYDIIII